MLVLRGWLVVCLWLMASVVLAQEATPEPFSLPTPIVQSVLASGAEYRARAEVWHDDGQFFYAIDDFSAALALDTNDLLSLIGRGQAYIELGLWDLARQDAELALILAPNTPDALAIRGYARLILEDALGADDLTLAITQDPQNGLAYRYRAQYQMRNNQYDEALVLVDEGLTAVPNDPLLWNVRAMAASGARRTKEALDALTKAIELDPTAAYAYINRGVLYRQQANYENALTELNLAVQAQPNYPLAYQIRANILIQLGNINADPAQYRAYYQSALNDIETYLSLSHPDQIRPQIISLREQLREALSQQP